MCSSGCPGPHSVDQVSLELRDLPASASECCDYKCVPPFPAFLYVFKNHPCIFFPLWMCFMFYKFLAFFYCPLSSHFCCPALRSFFTCIGITTGLDLTYNFSVVLCLSFDFLMLSYILILILEKFPFSLFASRLQASARKMFAHVQIIKGFSSIVYCVTVLSIKILST